MDKTLKFSFKKANSAYKYFFDIYQEHLKASASLKLCKKHLINLYLETEKQKTFASLVGNQIIDESFEINHHKFGEFLSLLNQIFFYEDNLIDKNINDTINYIFKQLRFISVARNRIVWAFTSVKKKKAAHACFIHLEKCKETESFAALSKFIIGCKNIKNQSISCLKNEFSSNKEKYCEKFNLLVSPFSEKEIYTLTEVSNFISNYNNLAITINQINEDNQILVTDILRLIDVYKSNEAMLLEETIRIESIFSEKPSVLKILEEYGYENLFDLRDLDAKTLLTMNGIGNVRAKEIIQTIKSYRKKINKSIKLKLSLDNKTSITSNILLNAEKLNVGLKTHNAISNIFKEHSDVLLNNISALKNLGSGTKWLFFSEKKKQEYRRYFNETKTLLESTSTKQILDSVSEYHKFNPTVDEVWDLFKNNPIEINNLLENIVPGLYENDQLDSTDYNKKQLEKIQNTKINLEGFKSTLRKYQENAVKFILSQKNVLLGDEMGLGKTIEAIAAMVSLQNSGYRKFVVVCPAGLIINWSREIVKHSNLNFYFIRDHQLKKWNDVGGVLLATYDSLKDFNINAIPNDFLIIDEAHYIKNPNALRSRNARWLIRLSKKTLLMTGTALENNVQEFVSLIECINPRVANKAKELAFMSDSDAFKQCVSEVYYRRKRVDVLNELPLLIESEEWCTLNPQEELDYENSVLEQHFMTARKLSWNSKDLALSCKAIKLLEIIENATEDGRKILVFSFFLSVIDSICEMLGEKCVGKIEGSMSSNKRQKAIDDFDSAPPGTVLCCQIQSGGVGLNIQSASVVVICEPQFKPSIENQAISRAYRMGQVRNVQVFRLLCENTLDERLNELLKTKQKIFDAFADKSVSGEKDIITNEEIGKLLTDEYERIKAKRGIVEEKVDVDDDEYNKELSMSYSELTQHLVSKYGPVSGNYFLTEKCVSKNTKISRSNEGLFVHHIDEDKAIMLSNTAYASRNPFSYQKSDRLCYCDILEHLILRLKIIEEPRHPNANENEAVGIGGAAKLIPQTINDCFNASYFSREYMNVVKNQVSNKLNIYVLILKRLWEVIQNNPLYADYRLEDLARDTNQNIVSVVFDALKTK